MRIKNVLAILSALLLSACAGVKVKDKEICAVAGIIGAGANCAHTLTDETREMTVDEFIYWLEPQEDRGPAMCMSGKHLVDFKSELEQACKILGDKCRKEDVRALELAASRVRALQKKSARQMRKYK